MRRQGKWVTVYTQKIGFNLWDVHRYFLKKYWMLWGMVGFISPKEKAWFLFIKRSAGL
ncbi:hypothetical protein [Rhizosphaericola mali]|uniref:hypothetical protein n=1 Tax=Rhizosphaericola mali TaxID=2545455 RepID=UPI001784E029|nr:hypothetical protein [Rhizosphaericola mali]